MSQLFCTKCYAVYETAGSKYCGSELVPFDISKHGKHLISLSNAWITVWNRWKDDPRLKEVAVRCNEEGCQSAAIILNEFITEIAKHEGYVTYIAGPTIDRPEDMVQMKAEITRSA